MDTMKLLVGVVLSLLLVVVVAGILASVGRSAMRKVLGLPASKLAQRFRKAFHAFERTSL